MSIGKNSIARAADAANQKPTAKVAEVKEEVKVETPAAKKPAAKKTAAKKTTTKKTAGKKKEAAE